jgi:hypothetical protein
MLVYSAKPTTSLTDSEGWAIIQQLIHYPCGSSHELAKGEARQNLAKNLNLLGGNVVSFAHLPGPALCEPGVGLLSNDAVADPWSSSLFSPQHVRREEIIDDLPYPFPIHTRWTHTRANIVELVSLLHYRWVQVPLYSLNPLEVYLVWARNYLRVMFPDTSPWVNTVINSCLTKTPKNPVEKI